jgi:ABC-type dipeptide/oligopeptide/nickel transport system permease subunit
MIQAQGRTRELPLPSTVVVPARIGPTKRSRVWQIIRDQPLGAVSACVLLVVVFCALFAELVAPQDPLKQSIRDSLQTPGFVDQAGTIHWLGTDGQGRDVLSRLIYGARISLSVGVGAVLVGTVGGLILGIVCGYRGGPADMVIQRITDSMQARSSWQ